MLIFNNIRKILTKKNVSQKHIIKNYVAHDSAIIYDADKIYNAGEPSKINIGEGSHISGIIQVFNNCGCVKIGDHCFIGDYSRIISAANVTIGNRVQVAHMCSIMDNDVHSLNPEKRHKEFLTNITQGQMDLFDVPKKDIIIEDDVWIASHCIIMKGVKIGRGAIIGAGSVVTKNIPPLVIVHGNPAKIVREIL
jgi:acetyltransferase-like isoleucine patch superfamily enzyme